MKRKTFASVIGPGALLGPALMSTPAQAATVAADSTPSPTSRTVQSTVSVARQAAASAYWPTDKLPATKPGDSLLLIGTLNSLNSFKDNLPLLGNKMYGLYFGSVIQAVYNSAQGL